MEVSATDFEYGKFALAFNEQTIYDLNLCINRYEPRYLSELFGVDLYALYTAGVTASDAIYLELQAEFQKEINSRLIVSTGVKDMLMGFIWCEYQRQIQTQQTTFGAVKNAGENSDNASFNTSMYQVNWLEALNTYEAIQEFILDNLDIYPTFNGQSKFPVLQF
jgi:hypothetical protein